MFQYYLVLLKVWSYNSEYGCSQVSILLSSIKSNISEVLQVSQTTFQYYLVLLKAVSGASAPQVRLFQYYLVLLKAGNPGTIGRPFYVSILLSSIKSQIACLNVGTT